MKRLLTLFFLWLGTLNGWAQAPSPAQVGITSAVPNVVQVYDSSHNWATIGTVDPVTHLFSPAGVARVLPTASTTVLGGVKIDGTTITIDGGGTISGTPAGITANSTVTHGFAADQLLKSDGTKIQLVGDNCTNWTTDVRYPMYLCGLANYPASIYITSTPGGVPTGLAFNAYSGVNSTGITINDGTTSEYGYYGFIHSTNNVGIMPDAGIMSFAPAILSVLDPGNQTVSNALRVYNTRTDNNNGEWGALDWKTVPNTLTIGTTANGTGTQRPVNIVGNPVTINGAALPSGIITAGTTPTSGFNQYQLLVSDGTKTQPVSSGSTINLGDTTYPIYMTALTNTQGVWPHIVYNMGGGDGGLSIFPSGSGGGTGITMPGGPTPGITSPNAFLGFVTYTNTPTLPDVAFTAVGSATAGFRPIGSPTTAENLRVYNTFTDFSNGEWGGFDWATTSNVLTIGTGHNGTGAVRPMNFVASALQINGVVAVSCAVGTVNAATMVVTNGIITHC